MKCNLTVLSVPVTQVLVNLVLVICSSLFVLCIRKKSNPSVWDKRSCSGGVCHVGIPDDQHLDLSPRVLLVQQGPGKHHSSIHHSENSVSRPLGTCITCHERPKAISIVLGGEHQQEFPPGKVLIVPAAVLSLRGMLVKISGLEEKGSKWSLCRVRGVLSSGAAAPRAQPCMSWMALGLLAVVPAVLEQFARPGSRGRRLALALCGRERGRRAQQLLGFAQGFGTVSSGRGTEPFPCFECSARCGCVSREWKMPRVQAFVWLGSLGLQQGLSGCAETSYPCPACSSPRIPPWSCQGERCFLPWLGPQGIVINLWPVQGSAGSSLQGLSFGVRVITV